ncbi:hypothetical protein PA01_18730 [Azoarcus sp. PA01]|nr:hypothetical protein PA01_18730 [Azoarcus sp. PA01]
MKRACRNAERHEGVGAGRRRRVLEELLGAGGDTVSMQPPFYCDYGSNIHLGARVFFNFNCTVLDVCDVRIRDYTLFGPGVQILAPRSTVFPPGKSYNGGQFVLNAILGFPHGN